MKEILAFISQIFTNNQDITYRINIPLLVIVIVLLLIALMVCVMISKKNRLYIKQDKKQSELRTINENEVA